MKKKFVQSAISTVKALIVPALLIMIWQIGGTQGWIKTTAISTPAKIWAKAVEMIQNGSLQKNVLISLRRVAIGFAIGAGLGIVLGILLGTVKKINDYLRVIMDLLRPVPVIVWVPVLILWVGIGEKTKIIVIAIGTFWPVFLNVMDGVMNVDRKYLEVSTIFCKSRGETIFHVILPAAVPYFISGIRIASGNALMGVVGAEMFAASSGIGYMVTFYREMNQPASMMVGVILIAIFGAIINMMIQKRARRPNHE
ncbi:MAG: ABC transporter permease [Lachnospiraceae bacterium]|nr:ABC transporter permease [Lachnospiraceae bacterium]